MNELAELEKEEIKEILKKKTEAHKKRLIAVPVFLVVLLIVVVVLWFFVSGLIETQEERREEFQRIVSQGQVVEAPERVLSLEDYCNDTSRELWKDLTEGQRTALEELCA